MPDSKSKKIKIRRSLNQKLKKTTTTKKCTDEKRRKAKCFYNHFYFQSQLLLRKGGMKYCLRSKIMSKSLLLDVGKNVFHRRHSVYCTMQSRHTHINMCKEKQRIIYCFNLYRRFFPFRFLGRCVL